eukprot:m.232762 g.232762  ORF g.232762 m.232762 type:complete len:372 (+) comp19283_c0_seq5:182-1297(+)
MSVTDKIAREILSGADGDYDLAGYDSAQVETLVAEAFSAPITCNEMMRCSFVVGGGKKVRAKYSATLGKDMTSALIAKGFAEDKGAATSIDSQGTFKYQHNTGTDLKSVHVFPFVNISRAGGDAAHASDDQGSGDDGRFSPLKLCIAQSQDDFMQTVQLKVKSYGQKKKLHKYLKRVEGDITAIETKLVAMEALTPSEEEIYGSAKDLTDKLSWLEGEMTKMIDNGNLTAKERHYMLGQLSEKVTSIQAQLDKARVDGANEKKIAKFYATLALMNDKTDKLTAINPVKRDIKHAMEIAQLKYRLAGICISLHGIAGFAQFGRERCMHSSVAVNLHSALMKDFFGFLVAYSRGTVHYWERHGGDAIQTGTPI